MILSERFIAAVLAIISLYMVGLVAVLSGLPAEVCTIRALIAAALTYVLGLLGAKCINSVLTSAMIDDLARKQKKEDERVNQG